MIIDIATNYPSIQVEDTEWFKQNNNITESIAKLKEERKKTELEDVKKELRPRFDSFEHSFKSFEPTTLLASNNILDFKSKLKPYEFDAKPELKKLQKETKLKQYQQTRPK